jgi:hypothetical protein
MYWRKELDNIMKTSGLLKIHPSPPLCPSLSWFSKPPSPSSRTSFVNGPLALIYYLGCCHWFFFDNWRANWACYEKGRFTKHLVFFAWPLFFLRWTCARAKKQPCIQELSLGKTMAASGHVPRPKFSALRGVGKVSNYIKMLPVGYYV